MDKRKEPPRGAYALFAFDGQITAEMLRRIYHVRGTPLRPGQSSRPSGMEGATLSQREIDAAIDDILDGKRGLGLEFPARHGPFGRVRIAQFVIGGLDGRHPQHATSKENGYRPTPIGVFNAGKFPYLSLQAIDLDGDVGHVPDSEDFLDLTRSLAAVIPASFVACDQFSYLYRPEIFDPRSFAWGVTYYGPELVVELGGPSHVESSPAYKVTKDDELGGYWIQLDELPFVDSEPLRARRDAVQDHLRLDEVFPNHG